MTPAELQQRLVATAAKRYRRAGRFAYYFSRGKLARDPIFVALLAQALIPHGSRLLDLGCGEGLLATWLLTAQEMHESGQWSEVWPAPPQLRSIHGIELSPRHVQSARLALGAQAGVERGDIRAGFFGAADVITIIDVLHYIDLESQDNILAHVHAALLPAGLLLLRVGDMARGLTFRISYWADKTALMLRGHGWRQLYCRTVTEWLGLLDRNGFETHCLPMSSGTPFANVLLIARPR